MERARVWSADLQDVQAYMYEGLPLVVQFGPCASRLVPHSAYPHA